MHALAMVRLIRQLHFTVLDASQVWFVDDANAVGPTVRMVVHAIWFLQALPLDIFQLFPNY